MYGKPAKQPERTGRPTSLHTDSTPRILLHDCQNGVVAEAFTLKGAELFDRVFLKVHSTSAANRTHTVSVCATL